MKRLFKNVVPYWKSIVIILVLLFVQAFCDLALPQYTSDIIDTGLINNGTEHILPEEITKTEHGYATLFMTDEEKEQFVSAYEESGEKYKLKDDGDKLQELDENLLIPIILTYQMSAMEQEQFKETVANVMLQNAQNLPAEQAEMMVQQANGIKDMTLEEIQKITGMQFVSFEAEDENGDTHTYVDMRPLIANLISNGTMSKDMITSSRDMMEKTLDSMGSSTLKSMGIAYASSCEAKAGIDIKAKQTSYLWIAGFKMIGVTLLMAVAAVVIGFFASRVGASVGRDLRKKVFTKVVGFSNTEMDKFSTASLITRSTNDIQQIQMVTTMMLRMILYAPILGIGGIIKVVNTRAGMGWIIVIAVVVILLFVATLMSLAMPKFKLMQTLVDKVNLVSREILTGLNVIRAFGREKTEEERFDKANKELTKTQLFTNRVMTFMMPGMMMIMYGVTLLIVWIASKNIDGGTLQVGQMTAFITYSMMIIMSFLMLTMMSIMLPRAGVAADRIDEVLNTQTIIEDSQNPEELTDKKGLIKFEHVNFMYPGAKENVLEDINFVAEPGKTTAIIGSTGCGKSTLVNLIPRFYDVTEGTVTLDGVDIRNLRIKDLRQEIGFVPQKGILFSGTIASNLRFGCEDATDEEIQKAAEIAQAKEFIEDKNDKYESFISQGGGNVSGGQKQRLAIARAIAKNPKVYVFDDSFSALDMKTDAKLRKKLGEEIKDATIIIVAQRVSTILHANQIIVLDDGKIVGKGTHEELLNNCEEYLQIAKSQLSDKELGIKSGKEEN